MALKVDCQPPEAEVKVDGVLRGSCGLLAAKDVILRLTAGNHSLEVSADGYRSFTSQVFARGMLQRLSVNLTVQR